METSRCCKCGMILTEENTYASMRLTHNHICKSCHKRRMNDYHQKNADDPEFKKKAKFRFKKWVNDNRHYYNNWQVKYKREHRLKVNGKEIQVKKRPSTNCCEICGKVGNGKKSLDYHHWNDAHPEWGIWVCSSCHFVAEFIDSMNSEEFKARMAKYLELQKMISVMK